MKTFTRDGILSQPISSIVDGWALHDGQLYLFVQVGGHTKTITIPRPANARKTGK